MQSAEYDTGEGELIYNPLASTKEDLRQPDGRLIGFPRPVELNIRKFKKHIQENFPDLTRSEMRFLAKQYKEKAWADFHEMVKFPFHFPTHSVVKDTTNAEQATNIPLA